MYNLQCDSIPRELLRIATNVPLSRALSSMSEGATSSNDPNSGHRLVEPILRSIHTNRCD